MATLRSVAQVRGALCGPFLKLQLIRREFAELEAGCMHMYACQFTECISRYKFQVAVIVGFWQQSQMTLSCAMLMSYMWIC